MKRSVERSWVHTSVQANLYGPLWSSLKTKCENFKFTFILATRVWVARLSWRKDLLKRFKFKIKKEQNWFIPRSRTLNFVTVHCSQKISTGFELMTSGKQDSHPVEPTPMHNPANECFGFLYKLRTFPPFSGDILSSIVCLRPKASSQIRTRDSICPIYRPGAGWGFL